MLINGEIRIALHKSTLSNFIDGTVVASASPSRKRLLEQACIPHRVQVSGIDEEAIQHADPLQLVQDLAIAKAKAVAHVISIGHKCRFRHLGLRFNV